MGEDEQTVSFMYLLSVSQGFCNALCRPTSQGRCRTACPAVLLFTFALVSLALSSVISLCFVLFFCFIRGCRVDYYPPAAD